MKNGHCTSNVGIDTVAISIATNLSVVTGTWCAAVSLWGLSTTIDDFVITEALSSELGTGNRVTKAGAVGDTHFDCHVVFRLGCGIQDATMSIVNPAAAVRPTCRQRVSGPKATC